MIPLSTKTRTHVAQLFAPEQQFDVTHRLEEFCAESLCIGEAPSPESLERVRFAVLKLSDGDIDALCRAIELARTDWRDLLVAAEFANDCEAHQGWSPEPKWRAG